MAQKLQNVLNSVINDLLVEGEMDMSKLKDNLIPDDETEVPTSTPSISDLKDTKLLAQNNKDFWTGNIASRVSGMMGNPDSYYKDKLEGVPGSSPLKTPFSNKFAMATNNHMHGIAQGKEAAENNIPWGDESGILDKASMWWGDLSTPQKAGVAALLATPLAAGAGALYLRKKQRAANRSGR